MIRYYNVVFITILILALALSGCGGGTGGGLNGNPGDNPGPITYVPGRSVTYTVGGVPFNMHYVPGGLTFASDVYSITDGLTDIPYQVRVDKDYWMAETELTYW